MPHALRLTEEQLADIVKRSAARLVDRNLRAEPHKLRDALPKSAKPAKRDAQREAGREYKTSDGEAILIQQMQLAGITDWVREYRFHPKRMWRLDFAFPEVRLAVEVDGGNWSGGRHVRGTGFAKDCEKHNELALAGWRLLRYTVDMLKTGIAVQQITDMLVGLQMGLSNSHQEAREPR